MFDHVDRQFSTEKKCLMHIPHNPASLLGAFLICFNNLWFLRNLLSEYASSDLILHLQILSANIWWHSSYILFTFYRKTCFNMKEYSSMFFCHFKKGKRLCHFLFASLEKEALSKHESTFKRKNLLLVEQILSFKS